MFTGIVEEIGIVEKIATSSMKLGASKILSDTELGHSIAIDGVCLTVTTLDGESFTVDISPETFRKTTLGNFSVGQKVNLERALRLSDRLGGHFVQGHVDEVGQIIRSKNEGNSSIFKVSISQENMRYIVKKGSIAVDGVSLTISEIFDRAFEVVLIPHTKKVTTIGQKMVRSFVNLEFDLMGRYVEKLLLSRGSNSTIDRDFLQKHRFIKNGN